VQLANNLRPVLTSLIQEHAPEQEIDRESQKEWVMEICGNCGVQLNTNSRFCSGCGTSVATQAAPMQQYVQPPYQAPYPPQGYPPQVAPHQQYAPPYPPQHYAPPTYPQPPYPPQPPADWKSHPATSHGIAQTFGLHPAGVVLTLVVNTMVFVTGLGTLGVGWLTSIPVGLVLGGIIYHIQKKWYGDDHESALLKACIVAFLTAIPSSLPGYFTIPSGILGFFRRKN
jgi:hypothetical protein